MSVITSNDELETRMEAALDAIRVAVVRLLRGGDVPPQLALLALARVTGEVGASAALAVRTDPEALLEDLAEIVRHAGGKFYERLEAETPPMTGRA